MKKKKPLFIKTDAHKKARLDYKWKKPRGLHNKMRLEKKGYRKKVKEGYKTPSKVRGLSPDGFVPVNVRNNFELKNLNKEIHGVIISGKVGSKKKVELIEEAKKLGLKIINFNADKKIEQIKTSFEERKTQKKERESEKVEKVKQKKTIEETVKKENKEKKEKTGLQEVESSEEDKKIQEKKEQDKILSQKNN